MALAFLPARIRRNRSLVALLAAFVLLATSVLPVHAQDPTHIDRLERLLYGRTYTGTYLDRLTRLERDLYGSAREGSIPTRSVDIEFMLSDRSSVESLWLQLRAIEWKSGRPMNETHIMDRLTAMELYVYGEPQTGPVVPRVKELVDLWFVGGRIPFQKVDIPSGTPVDLRLEEEVSSKTAKVGQVVKLTVVNNVVVDGILVIPKGSTAELVITEAQAGTRALMRQAKLNVELKRVKAIDGSSLAIAPFDPNRDLGFEDVDQEATTQLAIGASILGMILLPPLGAAAGLLVKADQLVLSQGTVIRAAVIADTQVLGVETVPLTR